MPDQLADKNNNQEDIDRDKHFKAFYLKFRLRIYWYVYRKINRSAEAEDIAAEVFLKLYENWNGIYLRGENGILAWVYTVARNASIDYLRKNKEKLMRSIEDEETDSAAKQFDNFVEKAMDDEDLQNLSGLMAELEDTEREILTLRFEEDLKFSEIAAIVQKNEGACKMILYRAIGKIRERLNQIYQTADAK